jgi:hypothetical protein
MPLFTVYLTCAGYAGVPVVWGGLLLELYGRTNSHVQEDTQLAHTPTSPASLPADTSAVT